MTTRHHPPAVQDIEQLEHAHHADIEGITAQVRALGRAVEAMTAAVEEFQVAFPDGLPVEVTEKLDAARWQLKDLW
jgi:hypothetical protein